MAEQLQFRAYAIYVCGPSPEGKFYVGQTSNYNRRCLTHQKAGGECPSFHKAVQRFGWGAMNARIVEQTDIAEEADRLERLFIIRYNALFPHGYNMTLGGRWVTFDPNASITNFQEAPVSVDDILKQAQMRLTAPSCPICGQAAVWSGSPCSHCGVHPLFGWEALGHLARDLPDNAFTLLPHPEFLKAFRDCRDGQLMLNFHKQRLRVRAMADAAPVAAAEYYLRLAPYIRTSLKRDFLASKGLASFNLGRWSPLAKQQRTGLGSQMKAERYFRRHKHDFVGSSIERIKAIGNALSIYGRSDSMIAGVLRAATENGASELEIAEAQEEAALAHEIKRQQDHERATMRAPGEESTPPSQNSRTNTDTICVQITLAEPSAEILTFYSNHIFATDLHWDIVLEGKPALLIKSDQPTLYHRLLFPDLNARRTEIRRLLKYPPRERRLEVIRTVGPPIVIGGFIAHNV
jgi:predicted GIY-YIG superfamily endonuclease